MQQPKFPNHVSKSKDPPCYEDAVKQTRTLQSAVQVILGLIPGLNRWWFQTYIFAGSLQGPTAASQQMDDLFDVLIKSGGEEQPTF